MSAKQIRKEIEVIYEALNPTETRKHVTVTMWMPDNGTGKAGFCSFPSNRSDLRTPIEGNP
jgi:hypothetical protein